MLCYRVQRARATCTSKHCRKIVVVQPFLFADFRHVTRQLTKPSVIKMNKFTWLILALVGVRADSALVVIVDGIPADQLTKRVVQHAVDDVIPIVEAPEQVIDVEFFPEANDNAV